MWGVIIGLTLFWPVQSTVEKLNNKNQQMESNELERYEQKISKEYESQEVKRLRMKDVYDYRSGSSTSRRESYRLGN